MKVNCNPNFAKLPKTYLFSEINQRVSDFLKQKPDANLIRLGIGDTTEPLEKEICDTLSQAAHELGTFEGYRGYGAYEGIPELREAIAEEVYQNLVSSDEIFISDGSKCDIGRLQLLFDDEITIAVQDPAYPVYIDTSILMGKNRIQKFPCTPENGFFPDLNMENSPDLFFFCSPNNPTGAAATREQLQGLVNHARSHGMMIIFDSAYAAYIQDKSIPKSIYEIEGANEVAIEVGSFSKNAGFTGLRLGWTIVPQELKFRDGTKVIEAWRRIQSTFFNGASYIVQKGGLSAFSNASVSYYMQNTKILYDTLSQSYQVYGGVNAPYLWVEVPGKNSWESFQYFLEEMEIVTTPGIGFGPTGEGFVRFSAFGHRKNIEEAIRRITPKPVRSE